MDCNHARLLLTFSHKRTELEAREARELQDHLGHCPECRSVEQKEQGWEKAVGKAMAAVPVPSGLESRLLARLQIDAARRRWPKVAGYALAACLLLGLGLGGYLWFSARPAVDMAAIQEQLFPTSGQSTAENVEEFFHDKGLAFEFPRQFNVDMLNSFEIAFVFNRRIPKLVFRNAGEIAEVYVLSSQDFDLQKDLMEPRNPIPGGGRTIELIPSSGAKFLYIVVYTGHSLQNFANKMGGV